MEEEIRNIGLDLCREQLSGFEANNVNYNDSLTVTFSLGPGIKGSAHNVSPYAFHFTTNAC